MYLWSIEPHQPLLHHRGLLPHASGTEARCRVRASWRSWNTLALTRADGLAEFTEQDARCLQALYKPFKNALQSYFALEQLQEIADTVENTFEAVPYPLFVLDAAGMLVFANRAATTLFLDGLRVQVTHDQLTRIGNVSGDVLKGILRTALAGVHQPMPYWWSEAGRLHNGVARTGHFAGTSRVGAKWGRARLVVVLQDDKPRFRKLARLLGLEKRYGLTSAESHILLRLSEGLRPHAIAAESNLRVSTVRTHIGHLLQKTAATGIFELVALLLG